MLTYWCYEMVIGRLSLYLQSIPPLWQSWCRFLVEFTKRHQSYHIRGRIGAMKRLSEEQVCPCDLYHPYEDCDVTSSWGLYRYNTVAISEGQTTPLDMQKSWRFYTGLALVPPGDYGHSMDSLWINLPLFRATINLLLIFYEFEGSKGHAYDNYDSMENYKTTIKDLPCGGQSSWCPQSLWGDRTTRLLNGWTSCDDYIHFSTGLYAIKGTTSLATKPPDSRIVSFHLDSSSSRSQLADTYLYRTSLIRTTLKEGYKATHCPDSQSYFPDEYWSNAAAGNCTVSSKLNLSGLRLPMSVAMTPGWTAMALTWGCSKGKIWLVLNRG